MLSEVPQNFVLELKIVILLIDQYVDRMSILC